MSDRDENLSVESMPPLARKPMDASRAGAYAALGALSGVVPIPWVPGVAVKRVRGALMHDIAARNGLSLTADARTVLEDPWNPTGAPKAWMHVARFLTNRVVSRLGPLAWLAPFRSAFSIFALGHLFERYIGTTRTSRSMRIDAAEARVFRRAMDKALLLVLTLEVQSPWRDAPRAPEDLRDARTQMVDGVVLSIASLPGWVVERMNAAFDEAMTTAAP